MGGKRTTGWFLSRSLHAFRVKPRRAATRKQPMVDLTKEMVGTDRPMIFWLHRSENPHRFELSGKTDRFLELIKMPRQERLPCEGCPPGVIRFAMKPIAEWAEYLDEVVVTFKKGVSQELPDRLTFQKYQLVSERCKDAFERIDPEGGHVFFPARVETPEGAPIGGPWFYMWCGRIYDAHTAENTSNILQDQRVRGTHYDGALATPDRCDFFRDMPVWTISEFPGPRFLSEPVFRALNEAGLTGFREYTTQNGFDLMSDGDSWADVVTPQNVSHIWL